jgi:hypothetical protein
MNDFLNKEEIKLVDDEIIDLSDFNSIEIQAKNSKKQEKHFKDSVNKTF